MDGFDHLVLFVDGVTVEPATFFAVFELLLADFKSAYEQAKVLAEVEEPELKAIS